MNKKNNENENFLMATGATLNMVGGILFIGAKALPKEYQFLEYVGLTMVMAGTGLLGIELLL